MNRFYIEDPDGNVITVDREEWIRWLENPEARRVRGTKYGDVWVSTVFLTIDHNFGEGPPILYETMVFADNSGLDQYQERYTTRADAIAGHERICKVIEDYRNGKIDDKEFDRRLHGKDNSSR